MLDDLGLSYEQIMEWGRLGKVELDNYQSNLSSLAASRILGNNYKTVDLAENDRYVFVTGRWNSNSPVIIKRFNKVTIIGPMEMLTSDGVSP